MSTTSTCRSARSTARSRRSRLLRQWFDQEGWYDRAGDLAYRRIVDIFMVASMGPPGGGRQEVTPRFIRHFSVIGYVEMSDVSKSGIFNTILGDFLSRFEGPVGPAAVPIVTSTIEIFNTILATLLPTPAKSHYTFNLRDLAKVIQGVLMGEPKRITEQPQILRLWVHELSACSRTASSRRGPHVVRRPAREAAAQALRRRAGRRSCRTIG